MEILPIFILNPKPSVQSSGSCQRPLHPSGPLTMTPTNNPPPSQPHHCDGPQPHPLPRPFSSSTVFASLLSPATCPALKIHLLDISPINYIFKYLLKILCSHGGRHYKDHTKKTVQSSLAVSLLSDPSAPVFYISVNMVMHCFFKFVCVCVCVCSALTSKFFMHHLLL